MSNNDYATMMKDPEVIKQMQEFRRKNRKRQPVVFDENSADHSNKLSGKRNCKHCYGRGYREFSTQDRKGLYRLDCICIKIDMETNL